MDELSLPGYMAALTYRPKRFQEKKTENLNSSADLNSSYF